MNDVITMNIRATVPRRNAGPAVGGGGGGGGGATFGSRTSAWSVVPPALTATSTWPPAFRADR